MSTRLSMPERTGFCCRVGALARRDPAHPSYLRGQSHAGDRPRGDEGPYTHPLTPEDTPMRTTVWIATVVLALACLASPTAGAGGGKGSAAGGGRTDATEGGIPPPVGAGTGGGDVF